MSRSYSKIRHIQEANIILEKRLLNEIKELGFVGTVTNLSTNETQTFNFVGTSFESPYKKYVYDNYNDGILKTDLGEESKIEFEIPFNVKNLKEDDDKGQVVKIDTQNPTENTTKVTLTTLKKKPIIGLRGKVKFDDIEIKISFKKFEKPIDGLDSEKKIKK